MEGRAPRALLRLVFFLLPMAAVAAPTPALHDGWKELSLLDPQPAREAFTAAAASDPSSREARLGAALARLQSRSRSPGLIAEVVALLEELRRTQPNDETGLAAAYYLARIHQLHAFTPDRPAAVAGYRALIAEHPDSSYAQLAAPKLAVLLLYDDVPRVEWERRVDEVTALIPRLSDPQAWRDVRLTLAMALIRLQRDHARAYPLLAACLENGSVTRATHLGALLVQAAESAHQLGKVQEERGWYERFLADFPRDSRADEIRRRLKEESVPPP